MELNKNEEPQVLTIDILDKLHDSGELLHLVKSGLISVNVVVWRKIFHAYQFQIKNGVQPRQAVSDTADVFRVSDRMVYRTIARFKI